MAQKTGAFEKTKDTMSFPDRCWVIHVKESLLYMASYRYLQMESGVFHGEKR